MGRRWISYRAFKGPYGVDLTKNVDGIEEPFNYAYSSWDMHIWR
jgi:hypothetical protein